MRNHKLALLAALALGAAFTQTEAKAVPTSCTFSTPAACTAPFSQGSYTISNVLFSGAFSAPPLLPSPAGIYFEAQGSNLVVNTTFFQLSPLAFGTTRNGSISFNLISTQQIGSFVANSTINPQPGSVTISTPSGPLAITGNSTYPYNPIIAPNTLLTVTYNWNLTAPGAITAIGTTFSPQAVPGPLPILGGGIAFGFSRRLRRRIQASKVSSQA